MKVETYADLKNQKFYETDYKKYFFELLTFLEIGNFGGFGNENHSKPTRESPYTHRIDRGNTHFQIMQKIFTGLENTFVGTGWP